jgi:hypothetical protein
VPTEDLPLDIDSIPAITSIARRPATVNPGESLGVRESVTVSMHDFKHNDVGFDPYIPTRGFNPYLKGSFWGKFTARWGSLDGYAFRTIDGYEGQPYDEMKVRHYIVDSTAGPDSKGTFAFTIKDVIKFFDGKKAQAPLPSNGTLLAGIDDTVTALTLDPSGIGDLEYPASGTASIGDEKVTFTRVADAITLTGRGLSGSEQSAHDAGDTFQLALVYSAQDVATIINDLLTNYTDTPAEYIPLADWNDEVSNYLNRLYTAEIMRPTSIKTLLDELIKEAGLIFYTDLYSKSLILKAFRQLVPTFAVTDDFALQDSIKSKRLESKRINQIWIYHGKKNPLENQDQKKNYTTVYAQISDNPIVALENNPAAISEVFSRWITSLNADAVTELADSIIERYETAPRQVSFRVPSEFPISLGEAVTIQSRIFEDAQGDLADPFTAQVTSFDEKNNVISAIAEEVNFTTVDPGPLRIITISSNSFDLDLKTVHDSLYIPAESGDTVRLIINPGVIIGSTNYSYALTTGIFAAGVTVEIGGTGRIQGRGGDAATTSGGDGGDALLVEQAIEIIDDVEIWSGGGAGGSLVAPNPPFTNEKGAGGAGQIPGTGSTGPGQTNATTEAGGEVTIGNTSFGGDPGLDGSGGTSPGVAGVAIQGDSLVTIDGGATPDIRGGQLG